MKRILPALFFTLGVSAATAWILLRPTEMQDFSSSLAAATASVSNIYFGATSGYFDPSGELRPLLHTWSLGVEEQFYLLFPVLLLLLWKRGFATFVAAIALIGIVSLIVAQINITRHPVSAFFSLQTRGWELILGSLLACYFARSDRVPVPLAAMNIGAVCGLVMIWYAVSFFDQRTAVPGLWALVPTLGAALVIAFAREDTLVGKLLGFRVFVWIGLISYSLYLWHQPLLAFARIRYGTDLSDHIVMYVIATTLCLSVLSWRFIEIPFRRMRTSPRATFAASGSVAAILLAFGLAGRNTDGFEDYYFAHRLSEPQKATYLLVKSHTKGDLHADMGDDQACNFWSGRPDPAFQARFKACAERYGKAVLVLGDSHGMNLYNSLYRAGFSKFLVGLVEGGCRPHGDLAQCHYDETYSFIKENRARISRILFHQSGSPLIDTNEKRRSKISKAILDQPENSLMRVAFEFSVESEKILIIAEYLSGLARLADVVWIGPQTESRVDFRNIEELVFNGLKISERNIRTFATLDLGIQAVLKQQGIGLEYFSLTNALKIDSDFLLVGQCLTYRDGNHFSVCGEKIVGERLKPLLAKTGAP
jgi:peptidoglycan/LPS O-acetylase OafA/YrhL